MTTSGKSPSRWYLASLTFAAGMVGAGVLENWQMAVCLKTGRWLRITGLSQASPFGSLILKNAKKNNDMIPFLGAAQACYYIEYTTRLELQILIENQAQMYIKWVIKGWWCTTYGATGVWNVLSHFQNFGNLSDVKCQYIVTGAQAQSASDTVTSYSPS